VNHAAQAQAEFLRPCRDRHPHLYGPGFDIALEIEAKFATLAARIMLRPAPTFYLELVDALADSVHMLTVRLAGVTARADAAGHAARLPIDVRAPELKRIENAAKRRVPRPLIDASDLATGRWVSVLTGQVRPLSGRLSGLLGGPAAARVSRELEELLRPVDNAACDLQKKLDAKENSPPVKPPASRAEPATLAECREARRTKMAWTWTADFDASREVTEVFNPLAAAVAALPDPTRAAPEIDKVVDAVHETVVEVRDLTTRADAAKRTAHLPVDQRGAAKRLVLDLTPPAPARPVITEAQLAAGTWVALLAELAAPYAEPLLQLLVADARIGGVSVSERLEIRLTEIDRAALTLTRRIDRIEAVTLRHRAPASPAPAVTPADKADSARAELARLGVPLP
jgi:hypothetical protein